MYKIIEAINYDKYKDLLDENLFSFFVDLDPTTDKKYAQWIIHNFFKMYKAGIDEGLRKARLGNNPNENLYKYPLSVQCLSNLLQSNKSLGLFFQEDHKKITNDLKSYTLLKNKNMLKPEEKNIMNIKGYEALWTLIGLYEDKLEQIELESVDSNEYEKWYEDKEWLVVTPHTHKAACKYGANTRWCTASRDDASMFDYYTRDGPLIIIINKGVDKWQLHFESNQWKDALDNEIGGRDEFLIRLPDNLKDAIYNKTNNILFLENFHVYIKEIADDGDKVKDILQYISGNTLTSAWASLSDLNDDRYSYPMSNNLLKAGVSNYVYQNIEDSEYYDEGYNHPWTYLNEEPLYKDKAEDCKQCKGSGFSLPSEISSSMYKGIDNGENAKANETLAPIEQKKLLSLYSKTTPSEQGAFVYKLIRNDEELAKKINIKCVICRGSGKENLRNGKWYSEEQREEAGKKAIDISLEYETNRMLKDFYSVHNMYQIYGRTVVDTIFDLCLDVLSGNPEAYINDFKEIVVSSLQIDSERYSTPHKDFEKTIQKYINEIRAKAVKN